MRNISVLIVNTVSHFRGLQQVRPAFRPPLRLGEQLHRRSEHALLPPVPLQCVRHGRRHGPADRGHAASCCAALGPLKSQLYR